MLESLRDWPFEVVQKGNHSPLKDTLEDERVYHFQDTPQIA